MEAKLLDNILIPKHEKLSAKETEAVLKKYKITTVELPKILKTDPALSETKVNAGDVIKITRKSQTAGESFYFRVVIEGK